MAIQITDQNSARVLAQAVKDGKVPEERHEEAMAALRAWASSKERADAPVDLEQIAQERRDAAEAKARGGAPLASDDLLLPHIQNGPEVLRKDLKQVDGGYITPDFQFLAEGDPRTFELDLNNLPTVGEQLRAIGKTGIGLADIGATLVTGAAAEPVAGIAGIAALVTGQGNDNAREWVEATSDFLSWSPKSERGIAMLEDIAEPLMAIEQGIDDMSVFAASGNPMAATYIKTTLMGGIEALGLGKLSKGNRAQASAIRNAEKAVLEAAHDLGIDVSQSNLQSSVVKAAKEMVPSERAANAPALREALVAARNDAKDALDAKFETARNGLAVVSTAAAKDLAGTIRDQLIREGKDIEAMPTLDKRLSELSTMADNRVGVGPRANSVEMADLNQFELVRRRINENAPPRGTPEHLAHMRMKHMMDDWLDQNINSDFIAGDASTLQAWKDARGAYTQWKNDFDADVTIKNLMNMEATPVQLNRWLFGASSAGAKPQAMATIKRLKNVLGDDHPSIIGMRSDFAFDLVQPLLKRKPNYNGFIDNFDKLMANNRDLAREMGLEMGDLDLLRTAAGTAAKFPPNSALYAAADIPVVLSRILLGNKLAKATLRVNLGRNMLRILIGTDRVSQKSILNDMVGGNLEAPFLQRGSVQAAPFIAAQAPNLAISAQESRER